MGRVVVKERVLGVEMGVRNWQRGMADDLLVLQFTSSMRGLGRCTAGPGGAEAQGAE